MKSRCSIKKDWISQTVCIISLVLTIVQYRVVYLQKQIFLTVAGLQESKFFDLVRESVPIDWFCFSIVMILLIYEVISAGYYWFNTNQEMT